MVKNEGGVKPNVKMNSDSGYGRMRNDYEVGLGAVEEVEEA
jgi:hypothetical protein